MIDSVANAVARRMSSSESGWSSTPLRERVVDGLCSVVCDDSLQTGSDDLGSAGESVRIDEPVDCLEQFGRELDGDLHGHAISIPIRITPEDRTSKSVVHVR